jgi:hypothetical protein
VAKRLSAATLTQETKAVSASTTLALVTRVKSPLLLKTILPKTGCARFGASLGNQYSQPSKLKQRDPWEKVARPWWPHLGVLAVDGLG